MIPPIRSLSNCWSAAGEVPIVLLDEPPIREMLAHGYIATTSNTIDQTRGPLCAGVSTADRGQTVENQLQPLYAAVRRLKWTVVAVYRDEGISGATGRAKAAWTGCSVEWGCPTRVRSQGSATRSDQ
jgi:hypothetical protein